MAFSASLLESPSQFLNSLELPDPMPCEKLVKIQSFPMFLFCFGVRGAEIAAGSGDAGIDSASDQRDEKRAA